MKPQSNRLDIPRVDANLPRARPSGNYRAVRSWRLGPLDEIAELRADLGHILAPADHGDKATSRNCEQLVLVASELVTNALQHGRPPVDVTLLAGRTWLLEVADARFDSAPVFAGRRDPGAGGMGLHVARRLALDLGWYTTHGHKHVWVTFPTGPKTPATRDAFLPERRTQVAAPE